MYFINKFKISSLLVRLNHYCLLWDEEWSTGLEESELSKLSWIFTKVTILIIFIIRLACIYLPFIYSLHILFSSQYCLILKNLSLLATFVIILKSITYIGNCILNSHVNPTTHHFYFHTHLFSFLWVFDFNWLMVFYVIIRLTTERLFKGDNVCFVLLFQIIKFFSGSNSKKQSSANPLKIRLRVWFSCNARTNLKTLFIQVWNKTPNKIR